MATPLAVGLAVAAAALAGRYGIRAWHAFKTRPVTRKFYEGGFQQTMSRREAALILGVRENVSAEKVKEAHRKVMVANHPDAGGSDYLAAKVNEAKDILLGKSKSTDTMWFHDHTMESLFASRQTLDQLITSFFMPGSLAWGKKRSLGPVSSGHTSSVKPCRVTEDSLSSFTLFPAASPNDSDIASAQTISFGSDLLLAYEEYLVFSGSVLLPVLFCRHCLALSLQAVAFYVLQSLTPLWSLVGH